MGGDTSQWQPNLFRNTTQIYPFLSNPGWNLITAMANDAIQWMRQLNEINPSMPRAVDRSRGERLGCARQPVGTPRPRAPSTTY